jgi:deoxyribonuclease-4
MRKLGVHTSIAGGLPKSLERAIALGCNTVQIFSHNPRGWTLPERRPDEIAAFREFRRKHAVSPVFIHASYLINLASSEEGLRQKSIDMLVEEMNIADLLGAEYVVLHAGSASGDIEKIARQRTIACLAEVAARGKWDAGLLLENTAGRRGDITSKIPELSDIVHEVANDLIAGICLDSCHAFASGYDVASAEGVSYIVREIDRFIGKAQIKLLHLNDSKGALGSRIDRHEHIGKGKIGVRGIEYLVNFPDFRSLPLILETPRKDDEDDRKNLGVVRSFFST